MSSFLFISIFIVFCWATVASSSAVPSADFRPIYPNGRIVGGEDTRIEDSPWQVSLQIYSFGYCGASIISDFWVITAAHCASYPATYVTVKAGTVFKTDYGSRHQARTIIKHEDYRTNKYGIPENDIALIQVHLPFKFDTTIKAISMFDYREKPTIGAMAVITGWGAVEEGGSTVELLRTVKIPVISRRACNRAYRWYGGLPKGQICAAYPGGGKDACQGDSGGPMTIDGRLAGIVSWGNGCARRCYPGVYTEIAYYRRWINKTIDI